MTESLIVAWLTRAAERIADAEPSLTALDQEIGDGDHGTNLNRGFAAITAKLREPASFELDAAGLLRLAGKTLVSTVGGASGPLYGTAFLRAAAALTEGVVDRGAALKALDAAVDGIAALGRSTTGEKTMLDALGPAREAARAAAGKGLDIGAVARAAADAAAAGAEATIPMLATKGRASYLGERSIGHKDPGATSSALLLEVAAEVCAQGGE